MLNKKVLKSLFVLGIVALVATLPAAVFAQGPGDCENMGVPGVWHANGSTTKTGWTCRDGKWVKETTLQVTAVTPPTTVKSSVNTRPAVSSGGCGTVTVLRGEGGYAVARRVGCSFAQLQAANPGVNLASLRVGRVLNRPCGSSSQPNQPNWTVGVAVVGVVQTLADPAIQKASELYKKITEAYRAGKDVPNEIGFARQEFNQALEWAKSPGTAEAIARAITAAQYLIGLCREVTFTLPVMIVPDEEVWLPGYGSGDTTIN